VLAGCSGAPSSETPATDTPTSTDEPVGTSGYETDLEVRSYEDEPVALTVSITRNDTGEQIFRENLTVGPDDVYDFDIPFPKPGNYTVRAVRDGAVYTYIWELERTDPGYELIVEANGGQVYFGKSAA